MLNFLPFCLAFPLLLLCLIANTFFMPFFLGLAPSLLVGSLLILSTIIRTIVSIRAHLLLGLVLGFFNLSLLCLFCLHLCLCFFFLLFRFLYLSLKLFLLSYMFLNFIRSARLTAFEVLVVLKFLFFFLAFFFILVANAFRLFHTFS